MNTHQLEIFQSLAETKSYSKTASNMYIAQSVVTYNINSLEKEIGVLLFERSTHGVQLTPAGEAFYENISLILPMLHNTIIRCRSIESNMKMIHIGFMGEQFITIGKSLFSSFNSKYPDIHVSFDSYQFSDSIRPLLNNEVNFMYVFEHEAKQYPEVEYIPIFDCEPCILISQDHKFSNKEYIVSNEISNETVYLFVNDNSGIQSYIKEALPNIKLLPSDSLISEYMSLALNAIVISPFSYDCMNKSVVSIPIKDFPHFTRGLAYKKNDTNPYMKDFIEIILKHKLQTKHQ